MSGGHWNYKNDYLCVDIFGLSPDYGERGFSQSAAARRLDPLSDPELSELVYDVFCILHSADWCFCGDTGEDTYRADIKRFKDKWFKRTPEERVTREIETSIDNVRNELYKIFGVSNPKKS